jgi:formylglycine-generating enzyme required for sulfatase activity
MNKKRKFSFNWKRELVIITVAVVLTTAGIKASDRLLNSEGKVMGVEEGCGEGMVFVPFAEKGFCIDRYEVSAGNNCPNIGPSNQIETRDNLNAGACRPVSAAGAVPWRFISQDQAAVACAQAGKRLPTGEEWFAAALGTPDAPGNWGPDDCNVDNNWAEQPGRAGSGKNCVSAVGAYDMVGNAWEWVQGAAYDGNFDGRPLPGPGYIDSTDGYGMPGATNPDTPNPNYNGDYVWIKEKGVRGIARGGYWDNKAEAGQYAVYMETPPSFAGAGVGFRCAQ